MKRNSKLKYLYKLLFIGAFFVFSFQSANAMPKSEEFQECLRRTSTNEGTAICLEQEIQEIIKATDEIEARLVPTVASKERINKLKDDFFKYANSYCLYYNQLSKNNAYGERLNTANCQIRNHMQYYQDLDSLLYIMMKDIQG